MGPSTVEPGRPGSKMHVLSDANGLPLLVGVSAANTHDGEVLKPMIIGSQVSSSESGALCGERVRQCACWERRRTVADLSP